MHTRFNAAPYPCRSAAAAHPPPSHTHHHTPPPSPPNRGAQEFNLYDESRCHKLTMRQPFTLGPFECTPMRVTHSIPDCCGLVLRSDHGTIVHTGDWKIDENPVDGEGFDREIFDELGACPRACVVCWLRGGRRGRGASREGTVPCRSGVAVAVAMADVSVRACVPLPSPPWPPLLLAGRRARGRDALHVRLHKRAVAGAHDERGGGGELADCAGHGAPGQGPGHHHTGVCGGMGGKGVVCVGREGAAAR